MNLNRTLAILAGVAGLCAVTAAGPAVATTALVTAGIGLLGGFQVTDAREERRKRFGDDQVTNAYRDIRQANYLMECCQSEDGYFYSNNQAYPMWATCETISKRRGEKLVQVAPQELAAPSFSIRGVTTYQCIGPKAAAKVNEALSDCRERLNLPQAFLAVDFVVTPPDNLINGVLSMGTTSVGDTTNDECDVVIPFDPEPPIPEAQESNDCENTIAGLGTVVGVGAAAAIAVAGACIVKKVKDKNKAVEIRRPDRQTIVTPDTSVTYAEVRGE